MRISKKVENMAPSGIREFFDLVLGMEDVISLGVGEPDFTTPWNIIEAGIYALEKGYTSYTSNKGLLELRQDISEHIRRRFGTRYDPGDEILITVGVSEAFDLALRAIIEPGDKVIVPLPSYVSYAPIVELAGGEPLFLETKPKDGFKILPEELKKLCKKGAKAIILNYPSNPTGVSYTKNELNQINAIVQQHKLLVISDEIYSDLTYDFEHTPYFTLKGAKAHTIYLNGFSKAYAMTGWRIGYACGPKELIAGMTKIHQYTMLCAPIMSQMAGREAIKNSAKDVEQMKKEYKRRRQLIVEGLNKLGLKCHMPDGAFYVFCSIKKTGLNSIEFAKRLLNSQKVAVVPGTAFGPTGEDYIRISYASSLENLKEALSRIAIFLKKL